MAVFLFTSLCNVSTGMVMVKFNRLTEFDKYFNTRETESSVCYDISAYQVNIESVDFC